MHKTTILQIIPKLNTGGAELSTVEMTAAIVAAGGRALIATEGGRMTADIIKAGGEIIPFPAATKNPFRIYKNAKALQRLIQKEQVDLVHARSRAPAWSALIAARASKKPFVTTYHGAYNNKGPFKNAYNSVMARGDIVIANSGFTADLIQMQHAPDNARLRIVHRGVDVSLFKREAVTEERIDALKTRWDVQKGQRIILQAARLTSWKGQRVVIEAASQLLQDNALNNTIFILAGDAQGRGGYEAELNRQIQQANLENHVKLVGHCADMQAAFAASYLSVVASTEPEAFGRAAVEAQALQCPVIVTDIGAARETVVSEQEGGAEQMTGWRVPPHDPAHLAQTLKKALQMSVQDYEKLGVRARSYVSEHFSLFKMQSETLAIYDELIGSNLNLCYKG